MNDLRELTHRLFDAFNRRDVETLRELYHHDVVWLRTDCRMVGRDVVIADHEDDWARFPESRDHIDLVLVDGANVVVEHTGHGATDDGPWSLHMCTILVWRDGCLVEQRTYEMPVNPG
jgi:ketosteroid isomerase-like protein